MMPEVMSSVTIWGGTGFLLKNLYTYGSVPYWAGFSVTNLMVRTSLFPFVLESAHTASRFAKIAPEVQFLVTIFQNDLKKQRQEGASFPEQRLLIWRTLQTLGGIYKLNKVHPLQVFVSPLLQLPVFMYVSVDLRKIINGQDPALAQQLIEGGVLWFRDLTEPDPWYALPILSGLLLYYNVEVAIGKQSLSGETASKSNMARFLKDSFQSESVSCPARPFCFSHPPCFDKCIGLAIFMPCFMSQSPAGLQIYLVTSFVFTLGQGAALRNNNFRQWVGLPLRRGADAPKEEPVIAKEFLELKKLEQQAREARGDRDVLGQGVLAAGLEASFAGQDRPTTIQGSGVMTLNHGDNDGRKIQTKAPHINVAPPMPIGNAPFVHGISAPPTDQLEATPAAPKEEESVFQEGSDVDMERANRGEALVEFAEPETTKQKTLDAKRFKKKMKKGKKKRKK